MTAAITKLNAGGSVCLAAALLLAGCGGSASSPASSTGNGLTGGGSAGLGTTIHQPVPTELRELPLTNQRGQRVDLASWPGRTVLLVPFLTLCQDVCPLTTGNLLEVQQSLRADHHASNVQIVELTVDPVRDTPGRLAAYGKLTHSDWQLVTTSPAELARLAKFFGFYYQKVPDTSRDARDWWTGKLLTYYVDHSDNYFVIDRAGIERVVQDAPPNFHGHLNPKLSSSSTRSAANTSSTPHSPTGRPPTRCARSRSRSANRSPRR
jgi:cytochrome oxidase Cu insertion factor (SCO1/SenC/PrrC family)